jgi:non-heme chloroperoxidase
MRRRDLIGGTVAGAAALALTQPARARSGTASSRPTYVSTPSGKLYVRSWGEGPAIVFLAGWALSSEAWSYQMARLSEQGFRCIAYDRRGHGRSDDPGAGYDYDSLADDLAAVLEALDVRDATAVAHSMSGGEVLRFMRGPEASTRVKRILFLATTLPCLLQKPDNPGGVPAAVFEQMRSIFYKDFPHWIESNADPFVVPETSPLMRSWIKSIMLQTSLRAVIDLNREMTSADFRLEMAQLRIPALFIHGDRDASAPLGLTGKPAAQITPGAKLTVYEGAPHGLFVTHIDRLNGDIAAFAKAG